jgi:hypothetical protein
MSLTRFYLTIASQCRSQWPRGLRRGSTAARLLGLWIRIQLASSNRRDRLCFAVVGYVSNVLLIRVSCGAVRVNRGLQNV